MYGGQVYVCMNCVWRAEVNLVCYSLLFFFFEIEALTVCC
jgi:hypothetical protein